MPPFHFLAQLAAQARGGAAADFVRRGRLQRRDRGGPAVLVHRHHGEEAAIHMAHDLGADVLGNDLDAHFHRRATGVIHRSEEGDQLADLDRLAEHHLVDAERDHVVPGVAAGAGVGHLVEQLEDGAAVDLAGEVGHVRRHQHRHRELVALQRLHGTPPQGEARRLTDPGVGRAALSPQKETGRISGPFLHPKSLDPCLRRGDGPAKAPARAQARQTVTSAWRPCAAPRRGRSSPRRRRSRCASCRRRPRS